MFDQLPTPVAGNRGLSFIAAALPIATVLVLLGVIVVLQQYVVPWMIPR
jgi:hypothetical protein